MHSVSQLYRQIYASQHRQDIKIDIYTNDGTSLIGTFGTDKLISLETRRGLYSAGGFSIGGCPSGEFDARFYATDALGDDVVIPKAAMVKIFVRLVSNETGDVSEWLPKGVFFVDTQKTEIISNVTTIHGFDAMIRTDETVRRKIVTDSRTAVRQISEEIGISVDSRTLLTMQSWNAPVEYDPSFGLSARKILSMIAAPYAANFYISDEGKLLLVQNFNDNNMRTVVADVAEIAKSANVYRAEEPFVRYVVTVNGKESEYAAGESSGKTLHIETYWGSQEIADRFQDVYRLYQESYRPFDASGCIIDPAAEIGDLVEWDGGRGRIFKQTTKFGPLSTSYIAAPYTEETGTGSEHSSNYVSPRTVSAENVYATSLLAQSISVGGRSVEDFVVECGASGMWEYRKWNSGIAECWGRKLHNNKSVTTPWGSGYYLSLDAPDDYPFSFIDYPSVSITLQASSGNGIAAYNNSTYSVSNPGNLFVYCPTSQTGVYVTINYHAIGMWK